MAIKILVVDDDHDVADTLARRLEREGYAAVIAYDGDEALEKVAQEHPDILLLDLMMPKKNGMEVLAEVRQKYKDRWIPVIIVSGQHDLDTVKKSYELEADHYLGKPCTFDVILKGIGTMISLMQVRQKA